MFATSSADRAGLLVAVITGGRPALKARPTGAFLDECRAAGVQDVVWVMNEHHAQTYERDRNPVVTYTEDWAYEYAAEHWMNPTKGPERGGFLGAFPGREAACREAEARGCWGVLQLDDNITRRDLFKAGRGGRALLDSRGGFGFHIDVLAGLTLSTNARMMGAQLAAVASVEYKVARTGFPYSCFVERVGDGREPWYGPTEDDITHALQYGDRADGSTAALAPILRYQKASTVTGKAKDLSGMRAQYGQDRARMLQRLNPQSARVGVKTKTSNGRGEARVFHQMPAGAIRNPLTVQDRPLFDRVTARLAAATEEWQTAEREGNREKARLRLQAHRGQTGGAHAAAGS